jgi:hypothetical protein
MIADFAHSTLSAFGFGTFGCATTFAVPLVAELRSLGLIAFEAETDETYDYVLVDRVPTRADEMLSLRNQALKGWVIVTRSQDECLSALRLAYSCGFCLHPRASAYDLFSRRYDIYFCVLAIAKEPELLVENAEEIASLLSNIVKLAPIRPCVLVVGDEAPILGRILKDNILGSSILYSDTIGEDAALDFVVFVSDIHRIRQERENIIQKYGDLLLPGGRLWVIIRSEADMELGCERAALELRDSNLIPELLVVPDQRQAHEINSRWMRYKLSDQRYWVAGWQALSYMCPPPIPETQPTFDGFSLLDRHDQGDANQDPYLLKSMISVDTRLANVDELEQLTASVMGSNQADVDVAAALCVKLYIMLSRGAGIDEFSPIEDLCRPFLIIADDASPLRVRWSVSLNYVIGLFHQRFGHSTVARGFFEQCGCSPFIRHSPTLATKTISACQQVAFDCLSNDDALGARQWLDRGLKQSLCALAAAGSYDKAELPIYLLPEIAHVASLGAQCKGALDALEMNGISPMIIDSMECDLASQLKLYATLGAALRSLIDKKKTT